MARRPTRSAGKVTKRRTSEEGKRRAYQTAESLISEARETGSRELDLSSLPNLHDLPPLVGLPALRRLRIGHTSINDIGPVASLQTLEELYFDNSPISDLSALRELTNLSHLGFWATSVKDLRPLQKLRSLVCLNFGGTKVADISVLADLVRMRELVLWQTNIRDLASISNLKELRKLNIRGTKVSDLAPLQSLIRLEELNVSESPITDLQSLEGLTSLSNLDVSRTRITSLSSLATLTGLVVGAHSPDSTGLSFARCRLVDHFLISLSKEENPARTIRAINYIRQQQNLPPVDNQGIAFATAPDAPPSIPAPGPGPHFVLRDDGVVDFAPPEALDREGNNIAHLRVLHPALRDLARALANALSGGNVPHANLLDRARAYLELVDQDLETIPFARLYVEGVLLQNATGAARSKILESELPSFEEKVEGVVGSLLDLHGTFMLSTADGHQLIVAEERFKRSQEQKEELRQATLDLARSLQQRPDLVSAGAADFVAQSAKEADLGANPDRGIVVASSMATNVTLVLVSSATVGALAVAAGALTGIVGGAVTTLIGYEAVKKSKSFQAVIGVVTKGIDQLPEIEATKGLSDRTKRLLPYAGFVLKIEPVLRRLAKDRSQFGWLNASLDWLKQHAKGEDTK